MDESIFRTFGFKKENLDVAGLKGNFWVRTASAKPGDPDEIKYSVGIVDAHRGENYGKAEARVGDEVVGYVQFSEAEHGDTSNPEHYEEKADEYGAKEWWPLNVPREIWVKYVYVKPEYRRQGIATSMYEKIKQEFPGEKLVSSGTTDEGGAFRRKLLQRGVIASRKDAPTSLTMTAEVDGFPPAVFVRWEQGMRWRQVLKSVKAIAGEIAGKRVPWSSIHVFETLWDNYEKQQAGWDEYKQRGKKIMFDILHNDTFVSVGAPYQRPAEAAGAQPLVDSPRSAALTQHALEMFKVKHEKGMDISDQPAWVLRLVEWYEKSPEDKKKAEQEATQFIKMGALDRSLGATIQSLIIKAGFPLSGTDWNNYLQHTVPWVKAQTGIEEDDLINDAYQHMLYGFIRGGTVEQFDPSKVSDKERGGTLAIQVANYIKFILSMRIRSDVIQYLKKEKAETEIKAPREDKDTLGLVEDRTMADNFVREFDRWLPRTGLVQRPRLIKLLSLILEHGTARSSDLMDAWSKEFGLSFGSLKGYIAILKQQLYAFAVSADSSNTTKSVAEALWVKMGSQKTSAEKIYLVDGEWRCICGNESHLDGFYPCDSSGQSVEPDRYSHNWDGRRMRCDRCGRIIDSKTLKVLDIVPYDLFGETTKMSAEKIKAVPNRIREAMGYKDFKCLCGNFGSLGDGFVPCDRNGESPAGAYIVMGLPKEEWDGMRIRCEVCGRIINQKTLDVVGMAPKDLFGEVTKQSTSKTAEKIEGTPKARADDWSGHDWKCACGNTIVQQSFYPCDREGQAWNHDWDGVRVRCGHCGRIISNKTMEVIGMATEDLFGGVTKQSFLKTAEKIQGTPKNKDPNWDGSDWECVCGNCAGHPCPGFELCDRGGLIQTQDTKTPYVRCAWCGRIINQYTMQVVGILKKDLFGEMSKVPPITSSHKTPPLSDTRYRNPEEGTETNAYADIPERVDGVEGMPTLEELAPEMFEKEAEDLEKWEKIDPRSKNKKDWAAVRSDPRQVSLYGPQHEEELRKFYSPLLNKTAVYAEAQNQSQHTDQKAVGMTKTLKSDPFSEEIELLHQSLGQKPPEPNTALVSDSPRPNAPPKAEGEDGLDAEMSMKTQTASVAAGQVYLLHFDVKTAAGGPSSRPDASEPPYARHYLGWAKDAQGRIQQHYRSQGADGVTFTVAHIWDGTPDFKHHLALGNLDHHCPICRTAAPVKTAYAPEYLGNCKEDAVVEKYFGDATMLAQALESAEKVSENEFYVPESGILIRHDPVSDVHSFYKTAANYDEMFKNILDLDPLGVVGTSFPSAIKAEINWAKKDLKKQDRIVWWLRWYRLALLKFMVDKLNDEQEYLAKVLQHRETGEPDAVKNTDKELEQIKQNFAVVWKWYEDEAKAMHRRTGVVLAVDFSMPWFSRSHSQFQHYLSLPVAKIQNVVWDKQTPRDLVLAFDAAEKEWQDQVKGKVQIQEGDEAFVQFPDGWTWWKLSRAYCSEEARAMGHCGNVVGQDKPDERIISLRKPSKMGNETWWEPHLTFIQEPNGYLGEMKGKGNQKPTAAYHKYIIPLLEDPRIKGVRGGGYAPERNFHMQDLTAEQQEAVMLKNPNLMALTRQLKEKGATKEVMKRIQDTLWPPEEGTQPPYDKKLKGWETEKWASVDDLVESKGNETAKWLSKQMSGDGEYVDWDADWTSALDDLDQKHLDLVHNHIVVTYPEEVKNWQVENDTEFEATENDIKGVVEDEGLDEVEGNLRRAAETGRRYGAEHEMYEALEKAVEAFEFEETGEIISLPRYTDKATGKSGMTWDSPVVAYLPLANAAALADKGEPFQYYEDENIRGETVLEVDDPYNGWDGWDKEAMLDAVAEDFSDPEPPKKPEDPNQSKLNLESAPPIDVKAEPTKTKKKKKKKAPVTYKDIRDSQKKRLKKRRKSSLLRKKAQEPWQQGEDEYAGRWNAEETEEQARARYQKKNRWEQSALAAMSLGKMTPEQAHEIRLYEWDKFKPLPDTLYHVTTAKSKVLSEGLMSRHELGMGSGKGLGGGTDKSISFTTDYDIAKGIYDNLLIARKVAAGEMTLDDLIDTATKGTGADRPWIDDLLKSLGGSNPKDKTNVELDALKRGTHFEMGMGRPPDDPAILPQYRKPGPWRPTPWSNHWTGGDGEEKYSYWERDLTPEEKRDRIFNFFKKWSFWREHAGGGLDPLYFCSDCGALGGTPESEIALLQFKPVPGAMGTQESGLGEWRIYTGAAVRLVNDIKTAAASVLKGKGEIDAHLVGDTMHLDWMYVKPEFRGKGLGTQAYKEWETKLPKNVKIVRLNAADSGSDMGNAAPFWEKMGFDFVYDREVYDPEIDNQMWKGVNGSPTPKSLNPYEGEYGEENAE